jgi:hypothetical protein
MLNAPTSGIGFGSFVGSAGDLNGDQLGDVVVGAYAGDSAYVYLGAQGTSWNPSGPQVTLSGNMNTQFGDSASAGDLNGDGLADLAISAYGGNEVRVYSGTFGTTWNPGTPAILSGPVSSTFGIGLSNTGDLNGDGFDDLVAGSSMGTFVYLGKSGVWAPAASSATITAPSTNSMNFGDALAIVGDINDDGASDLVIGAPASSTIFVYPGVTGGSLFAPTSACASFGGTLGDNFGGSVASRVGVSPVALDPSHGPTHGPSTTNR